MFATQPCRISLSLSKVAAIPPDEGIADSKQRIQDHPSRVFHYVINPKIREAAVADAWNHGSEAYLVSTYSTT